MAKTVTLSVKNVPVDLARRLKERAERNHRSLQGELRAILEQAGDSVSVRDIVELTKRLKLNTPSESVGILRKLRDDGR